MLIAATRPSVVCICLVSRFAFSSIELQFCHLSCFQRWCWRWFVNRRNNRARESTLPSNRQRVGDLGTNLRLVCSWHVLPVDWLVGGKNAFKTWLRGHSSARPVHHTAILSRSGSNVWRLQWGPQKADAEHMGTKWHPEQGVGGPWGVGKEPGFPNS